MYRTLLTLSLASGITLGNAYAANDKVIKDFCENIDKNRKLSEVAIENNGYIKYKTRLAGTKRKKTKRKMYRGCRFDTRWIKEAHELFCDSELPKAQSVSTQEINRISTPQNILYFFDGAGDFDAEYAANNSNAVNIDGSEGTDLGMGNANGLKALTTMMYSNRHSLGQNRDSIELHYHASSGLKGRENYASALACAKQSKYYLEVLTNLGHERAQPKWLAMGFSNGGELTIDFQNDIADEGVRVDLAVALDPVVQTIKYPLHGMKKFIGEKNKKTKRLVSIYQNTDHGSLPYLELKGKPVYNADVNILMNPEDHLGDLRSNGLKNHIRMVKSVFVYDATNCEFGKVFDSSYVCDY